MAKVLIQDIARELKMSRNTVSRALKNEETVNANTRTLIAQTALRMGYDKVDPSLAEEAKSKRADSTNKRYAILMNDHADDDFWRSIIWGITETIQKAKATCILMLTTDENVVKNELPEVMVGEKIDGVICLALFPRAYYEMLQQRGYVIVGFDMPPSPLKHRLTYDVVMQAGEMSVYELTSDLINRGCRNIGFIGDITYCQSIKDRYNGYLRAMTEASLQIMPQYCLTRGKWYFYERNSLEAYVDDMGELPEAIVCASDQIALNVIQILKKRGVEIPKRVAITGFDNKRECMIVEPHLTSVSSGGKRIGVRLAQQLLWRLEHPNMHLETVLIDTRPVYRESSDR